MSSFITAVDLSFPPAERVGAEVEYFHYLPHEKQYVVNVYFIGPHTEPETIDRVLRECLALAAAHDGRFNIHASAYLLPQAGADKDGRQEVQPYKMGHFLCFDAALRQIGVRRYGKKHFEQKWVITDVTAAGTGDNETYLDRPVHPLHDSYLPDEGESTDATEDMRVQVLEWVWYGYYTAAAILRWIDEGAAEGGGFDHGWIKAYATAVFEKKRAAEATWPQETDCDRLDNAFGRLNEQGVCALQWAGNTISEGMESVSDAINDEGVPEGRYQGFCFFHSQDIDRALGDEGLMLAFGPVDSDEDEDAVRIGRLVCEAFQREGLQTDWKGTADSRINLPRLRWQRRTPQPD